MFILSISGNITDFGQDPDALDKKVPGYGAEHMTPSLVRSGPAWSQRPSAITKAASETRVNRARGRGGRRLWRIHYRDRALANAFNLSNSKFSDIPAAQFGAFATTCRYFSMSRMHS
jgi:hypothetical protein